MNYKKIALFDSTDFTGKLDKLLLEYARNNEFNQDTLIHFYYEDYVAIPNFEVENECDLLIVEIMKEIYILYPELIGEDLYIHFWW